MESSMVVTSKLGLALLDPYLAMPLIWVIQQSGFYTRPYRCNFTSHTSSSPLPLSSHTRLTLTLSSPYPRRPSPQYLPTPSSLPQSSPSKESDGRHHQHCISGIIRVTHQFKLYNLTHRSTRLCTCIFIVAISKPCAEARSLQDQGHHNLNSLHPRRNAYFHSKCQQVTTSAQW